MSAVEDVPAPAVVGRVEIPRDELAAFLEPVLRSASAEVVVRPPSSQAGLAAVRYRLGGPVAEPAGPADHRG